MIERINPEALPSHSTPFSHATRAGGFVFVSGQTAMADGDIYVGDFAREVDSALDNLESVLAAAGARLDQVVRVGAYISNALLFAPFNEIYRKRFGTELPARTTVVTAFAHPNVRIEVEAIAYVG